MAATFCEVFKINPPETCKPNEREIVKWTNFEEHYPAVHTNMAWKTLKPYIRQATEKYLYLYICEDVYCCIAEKYQSGEELSENEEKLLCLIQDAVAHYAIHYALPFLNTVVADMGVQENQSSDFTSQGASAWRYNKTLWAAVQAGDLYRDKIITCLDELPINDPIKIKWKESKCYPKIKDCLFDMCAFQECIDIKNSPATFFSFLPWLKKASRKVLIPIICKDLYQEICNENEAGELSEANAILLNEYIRPMLAHWSVWHGIPSIRILIESDGLKMVSSSDGQLTKAAAYDSAVEDLACKHEEFFKKCKIDLLEFLKENKDDYPIYKNSACCPEDAQSQCGCVTGTNCGGIYF